MFRTWSCAHVHDRRVTFRLLGEVVFIATLCRICWPLMRGYDFDTVEREELPAPTSRRRRKHQNPDGEGTP